MTLTLEMKDGSTRVIPRVERVIVDNKQVLYLQGAMSVFRSVLLDDINNINIDPTIEELAQNVIDTAQAT